MDLKEPFSQEKDPTSFDPAMTYNWALSLLPLKNSRFELNTATGISLPQREQSVQNRTFMGRQYSVVTRDSSSTQMSISFYDDQTMEVYSYMKQWFDQVTHIMETKHGYSTDPRQVGQIIFFDIFQADGVSVVASVPFVWAYPSGISELSYSYGESDLVTFTVTFEFMYQRSVYDISFMRMIADLVPFYSPIPGLQLVNWMLQDNIHADTHISGNIFKHPIETVRRFFRKDNRTFDKFSRMN